MRIDEVTEILANFVKHGKVRQIGYSEICHAPNHPKKPELGNRDIAFTKELYIDADDFEDYLSQQPHENFQE